jgi:hypothetical protein
MSYQQSPKLPITTQLQQVSSSCQTYLLMYLLIYCICCLAASGQGTGGNCQPVDVMLHNSVHVKALNC